MKFDYQNTISYIHDVTKNEYFYPETACIELTKIVSNGSNSPIWRLSCNKRIFTKCSKVNIGYRCQTCNRENYVSILSFYRRANRKRIHCPSCVSEDKDIIQKQLQTRQETSKPNNKEQPPKTLLEKIKEYEHHFAMEDDDFKNAYFRKHLTSEEFEHHRRSIFSFQHKRFTNIDDFIYIATYKVSNQFRYAPYVYDTRRDCIEKLQYVNFQCSNCSSVYECKEICNMKNRYKPLCPDCSFSNKTFKIKCMKNMNGISIKYQSQYEKRFIEFCNKHNIEVLNGPTIQYQWNEKIHNY
jgi:hypothetical protein